MGIASSHSVPQPAGAIAKPTMSHRSMQTGIEWIWSFSDWSESPRSLSWLEIVPAVKGIDVLAVTAVLGGGYPVFREALENLLARRMTMELSMTIALTAALAIREFTTALFILFFVLGAEILEHLTVDRGRKAIRDLLSLLPKRALVRRERRDRRVADRRSARGRRGSDSARGGDPGGRRGRSGTFHSRSIQHHRRIEDRPRKLPAPGFRGHDQPHGRLGDPDGACGP